MQNIRMRWLAYVDNGFSFLFLNFLRQQSKLINNSIGDIANELNVRKAFKISIIESFDEPQE